MIGILLSVAIFIVIVTIVSYVVSNAIEDERQQAWLNEKDEVRDL